MKTPSPIYPLVALGLALMFAMIGALTPPRGARAPAHRPTPNPTPTLEP